MKKNPRSRLAEGLKKRGYFWITLAFFLVSLVMHWIFAWKSYKSEQIAHHQPVKVTGYVNETLRDTMENWQSEFLQLIWQVVGLSYFLYVGSPSSKEGDQRVEEKIDYVIKLVGKESGEKMIRDLEKKYPKN